MPQCSFIFFHMKLHMQCTYDHMGNFHIFKLSDFFFLTLWGINLSLLLNESRGIAGGHRGVMGNSSAFLALP